MWRKTIGRPINKRYLGDAVGSIKVSHYFRVGGSEQTGEEDTHIVSQRSSNKFLVADTSGAWSEVLTLVDKNAGSLAEGEFRIDAQDSDGNMLNTIRLYNRTIRVGEPGNPAKVKWSANAPADQAISGITQADPAVVTVADTSEMVQGETVTISGVVGMVEVNDLSFEVNILNGTTFELVGENSTGHTAYTSGGLVSGIGNTGSIDTQVS